MLLTILSGLLMLGILVFVHELGHFLVAKAFGVRVLVFSLGFGPRIFGFTRGDTDYRISALPLGGYVRMYGDDFQEDIPEAEWNRSFLYKPIPQKAAISFAGPFANFLLPFMLFFAFFIGSETLPGNTMGTVIQGSPADVGGLEAGDTITAIDGQRVEHFEQLRMIVEKVPAKEIEIAFLRDGQEHVKTMKTGISKSINPFDDVQERGQLGVMPYVQESMVWVSEPGASHREGLRTGDRIDAVGGAKIQSAKAWRDTTVVFNTPITASRRTAQSGEEEKSARSEVTLTLAKVEAAPVAIVMTVDEAIKERLASDENINTRIEKTRAALASLISEMQSRGGILPYAGTIKRVVPESVAARLKIEEGDLASIVNGERVSLSDRFSHRLLEKPEELHAAGILKKNGDAVIYVFGLEDDDNGFKSFGAIPGGDGYAAGDTVTRKVGVTEAASRALKRTWGLGKMIVKGLGMLFTGQVGMESIGGPVTIVRIAGDAARNGFAQYVEVMAFISVNLGIVNLLPVPVLDGGHLTMFAIEALQRRRLTQKTRMRALVVGLVLIFALFSVVIVNDILALF